MGTFTDTVSSIKVALEKEGSEKRIALFYAVTQLLVVAGITPKNTGHIWPDLSRLHTLPDDDLLGALALFPDAQIACMLVRLNGQGVELAERVVGLIARVVREAPVLVVEDPVQVVVSKPKLIVEQPSGSDEPGHNQKLIVLQVEHGSFLPNWIFLDGEMALSFRGCVAALFLQIKSLQEKLAKECQPDDPRLALVNEAMKRVRAYKLPLEDVIQALGFNPFKDKASVHVWQEAKADPGFSAIEDLLVRAGKSDEDLENERLRVVALAEREADVMNRLEFVPGLGDEAVARMTKAVMVLAEKLDLGADSSASDLLFRKAVDCQSIATGTKSLVDEMLDKTAGQYLQASGRSEADLREAMSQIKPKLIRQPVSNPDLSALRAKVKALGYIGVDKKTEAELRKSIARGPKGYRSEDKKSKNNGGNKKRGHK